MAVLWRFGRPHTLIGSWLTVGGLWAIAVALDEPHAGVADLWWTLVAATAVNVAIVGLNQITDVEIDRVNKPRLPVASGELSVRGAWWTVGVAAIVPLLLALSQGALETAAVVVALAVGAAYSLPPVRLKRHAAAAALCIAGVRALVVNLGVYGHYAGGLDLPGPVWALALFVLPFSFAIAVLKDVPDREGDRRFRIATFTVRLGPRRAARIGLAALVFAYLGMAVLGPLLLHDAQPLVLAGGHLAALALLLAWARRADPADFAPFYLRVWALFFLESALVPAAVLAA